ncbi:unnamed protein product, partial [Urochloa humidicola]
REPTTPPPPPGKLPSVPPSRRHSSPATVWKATAGRLRRFLATSGEVGATFFFGRGRVAPALRRSDPPSPRANPLPPSPDLQPQWRARQGAGLHDPFELRAEGRRQCRPQVAPAPVPTGVAHSPAAETASVAGHRRQGVVAPPSSQRRLAKDTVAVEKKGR